jgi:hypothetical protein
MNSLGSTMYRHDGNAGGATADEAMNSVSNQVKRIEVYLFYIYIYRII